MAVALVAGWSAWLPLAKPSVVVVTAADFAMRRNVGPAVLAAVVVMISLVIQPDVWGDWVRHLLEVSQDAGGAARIPVPLIMRMPVAALLSVVAWRTRRPWLLAPAMALSLPILWIHGLAVLTAIPRLMRSTPLDPRRGRLSGT